MDGINIDDLTIEQHLRLTQENQTPSMVKKVDDMTISEYIEYEERMKSQYNRNSESYFLTYFGLCTSSNKTTIEFPRNAYFNPIPPNTEFNYDYEDMELDEKVGYTNDVESIMISSKALPQRVWGLRVVDSYTGNYLEDSFMPLETIQSFKVQLGEDYIQARRGCAKDSIATQTCELSKKEFNDFLTLYPIPSKYRVILPKSNQTIFDTSPGFIYRGSTFLVVPSSPLLLSCAKLMVVSPLFTSSRGSSICVKLRGYLYYLLLSLFSLSPIYDLLFLPAEIDFRKFIYIEDDDDLSFWPKEPSPGFGTGSPSVSVNTDIAARIKDMKCKTKGGSSRPPVERKLAPGSSTSHATRAKTSSSKDGAPFLTVSDEDKGLPDVLELQDAIACQLKISSITPPT
ncbi:hypothetical protein Tco_1376774 [Tanacetum coccineum]